MTWKIDDPEGAEVAKITWELVRWTRGRVLDIGCGALKGFPHFIGVDNCKDTALFGHPMKPDVWVEDAANLAMFGSAQFDAVFSSHLLEHFPYAQVPAVLAEWWRVLKVGGYLVLYLPDEDQYPKVGEKGANPDHKWDVNQSRVLDAMRGIDGWDLVDYQVRSEEREYSLWFVFQKLQPGLGMVATDGTILKMPCNRLSYQNTKPTKTVGVVRYGAYGDILQASSVFAGLKEEGYHVTLYCSPPGTDVIQHDPNIDDFYLQDKDQVPNQALGQYWDWHKKKYDRWINLSESEEGTLLALPGRFLHTTAPALRHKLTNFNYLEFQHDHAGVPYVPRVRFYATDEERQWAREERARMGAASDYVIAWSLAGSSVHKVWPYVDQVVAKILLNHPHVHVVFVGGDTTVLLEQGWFKVSDAGVPHRDALGNKQQVDPRVHCRSGDWSIRRTMAFAQQADLVIGPETGVLNGVCMEQMPKIVFLSHSTHENLTRDWVNTFAASADHTVCPGRGANAAPACHQLHYNWNHCQQATDEKGERLGIAQCQYEISGEEIWQLISSLVTGKYDADMRRSLPAAANEG